MGFIGGSAWAMSREIAGGFHHLTDRSLRLMSRGEVEQLVFELDRHLKEVRGEQPPSDDLPAVQKRHRRIQRMTAALVVIRAAQQRKQGKQATAP